MIFFSDGPFKFVLSFKVLEELENLKGETSKKGMDARAAVDYINKSIEK